MTMNALPRRPRGGRPLDAVILAAGKGKRMHSALAKVLHPAAGRPMIDYAVRAALELRPRRLCVVLGNQAPEVRAALARWGRRLTFCLQRQQRGTGHAVQQTARHLAGDGGDVLILNGDTPALTPELLQRLLREHRVSGAAATLVTAVLANPTGYGRIVRDGGGDIAHIVEERDATPAERGIREINCGIYVVDGVLLFPALRQVKPLNKQGEFYLTDVVRILRSQGHRVRPLRHSDADEVLGVNTRRELAFAGRTLQRRKAASLMAAGVSLLDAENTYIDTDVRIGAETVIYPGVHVEGSTQIGRGCRIEPGCVIRDSVLGDGARVLAHSVLSEARLRDGAQVGPFTHLRPGSDIGARARIGNFVEVKKSRIGDEAKANHLTYLGDARLGRRVNVGAGTITCNYDGRLKHRTVLEDDVFIGSDTQLVAPVRVRRGAYVAAGSTITRNVPAYALALSRSPQLNKADWVRLNRGGSRSTAASRRRGAGRKGVRRKGARR